MGLRYFICIFLLFNIGKKYINNKFTSITKICRFDFNMQILSNGQIRAEAISSSPQL